MKTEKFLYHCEEGKDFLNRTLKALKENTFGFIKIKTFHWSRKWQPTPVFLPGKLHGWRSLMGYSPRSYKGIGMT